MNKLFTAAFLVSLVASVSVEAATSATVTASKGRRLGAYAPLTPPQMITDLGNLVTDMTNFANAISNTSSIQSKLDGLDATIDGDNTAYQTYIQQLADRKHGMQADMCDCAVNGMSNCSLSQAQYDVLLTLVGTPTPGSSGQCTFNEAGTTFAEYVELLNGTNVGTVQGNADQARKSLDTNGPALQTVAGDFSDLIQLNQSLDAASTAYQGYLQEYPNK